MRRKAILLVAFALLALVPLVALADAPPPPPAQDPELLAKTALSGLAVTVNEALHDQHTPGAAIAVVWGGKLVFAQGYGLRDVERKLPVTTSTRFMIGSTTKAFTSLMLGQLAEAGKLTWDSPMRSLLPDFAVNDEYATTHLTLRDLLTHRTGVARSDLAWYGNPTLTRVDLFEKLKHLPLSGPLRQKWEYNNFMYAMAGFTLERLTGQTWEQNLQTRVLAPLGMTQTLTTIRELGASPDRALGYHADGDKLVLDPYHDVPAMAPAGSTLSSSVLDMAKWLILHLGDGTAGGKRVVVKSTLSELHRPQMMVGTPENDKDVANVAYALGWGVDVYRGHRRVHHSGGIDGFITEVALFPDDGIGIVVLCNAGDTGLPGALRSVVFDRLLGLTGRDWLAETKQRREKAKSAQQDTDAVFALQRVAEAAPSHPLERFVGRYTEPAFGTLEVRQGPAGLELHLGGMHLGLRHHHFDSFLTTRLAGTAEMLDVSNQPVQFLTNFEGDVAGVELPLETTVPAIRFVRAPDARLSDPVFLSGLVGTYHMDKLAIRVFVEGQRLLADVPGQRVYTLRPGLGTRFAIDGVPGATVTFHLPSDPKLPVEAVLIQPGVALKAAREVGR